MQSNSRTRMPERFSSQLIAFNQALYENREDIAQHLHLLMESIRLANREDLLEHKSILQQVIVTTPKHGSPAARDFFMALSFLLKTINSSKKSEFEKNKNLALEVFEKEFISSSRLYTSKASASLVEELDTAQNSRISALREKELLFYFSGKNTEIASFISQFQTGNVEQIVENLVACQQFERELVLTFLQLEHDELVVYPLESKEIYSHDLDKFERALDKSASIGLEIFSHFIVEYNASLLNSLLLIEKLILALKERRESIEITLFKELGKLKETVSTTYFSTMTLLNITENMKAWSLQCFQNPRKCSSDLITSECVHTVDLEGNTAKDVSSLEMSLCDIDFPCHSTVDVHLQQMIDQETRDKEEFLRLCGSDSLLEQFKRRSLIQETSMTMQTTSTIDTDKIGMARNEYREQAFLFNCLHNIYLKELNSLEELSRLCGPESLLEQYKQRALAQENITTAIQTTSKITFNRWEKWQKEMVGYLSSSVMSCSSALWQSHQEAAQSSTSSIQLEIV